MGACIAELTKNFDEFEEDDLHRWGSEKRASRRDKDQSFIGYTFKRQPEGAGRPAAAAPARAGLSAGLFQVPESAEQQEDALAAQQIGGGASNAQQLPPPPAPRPTP
ncbi:unnamed protein product [Heterosigma akashiwo]